MFTELEKKILDATDPKCKYIFRKNGNLYLISTAIKENCYSHVISFGAYNHIFNDVRDGDDPICFRKQILDYIEREYLKAVFKPFHNRIKYVEKIVHYEAKGKYYIWARVDDDDDLEFPLFDKGKMYEGMKTKKHYTLSELGITYDN